MESDIVVNGPVIGTGIRNEGLTESEKSAEKEILVYIEDNMKEIKNLNYKMLSGEWLLEDSITVINNEIALSDFEFQFRGKISMMDGEILKPEELLELLIKEKIIFMEAMERNLIDEEELLEMLEHVLASRDEDYRERFYEYERYKIIQAFAVVKLQQEISESGKELDEYVREIKEKVDIEIMTNEYGLS